MTILDYQRQWNQSVSAKADMPVESYPSYSSPFYSINFETVTNILALSAEELVVTFHPNKVILPDIRLHNHDYFELVYVYKGSCVNYFEHEQFNMTQGDVLLLNPNVFHEIISSGPEDCIVNILINCSLFQKSRMTLLYGSKLMLHFFADYFYKVGGARDYLFFRDIKEPSIPRLLESIVLEYFEKLDYYQSTCQALLILLLLRLSMVYSRQAGVTEDMPIKELVIMDILRYMKDYCQDASLYDVAKHFGYSSVHIGRLVKKHTGKTFRELLKDYRIDKFKQYLVETDFTIEQIAEIMHFKTVWYLYDDFKKRTGKTPSEYRQTHISANTNNNHPPA